jgi:hypothetical protein
MGLFKRTKDNVADVSQMQQAGTGQMAAGQAMYDEAVASGQLAEAVAHNEKTATATVSSDELEPIAGVSLELFAEVTRGLADYNYDQTKAVVIAEQKGIAADAWQTAADGWNERITANPALSQEFSRLYTGR